MRVCSVQYARRSAGEEAKQRKRGERAKEGATGNHGAVRNSLVIVRSVSQVKRYLNLDIVEIKT